MSYLDRTRACNTRDLSRYRPFQVDGVHIGFVRHDMAEAVRPYADVFAVSERAVVLDPRLKSFEDRTAAVDAVLSVCPKTC